MDYIVVLYAIIAALGYALVFYAKTWAQTQPPEAFNYTKFGATLILGCAVGVALAVTGNPITKEAIETQLLAYGAVTALVETILKTILSKLNLKYPGS
jgi:Kef-type K+ transport system membrane component KefB